MKTPKRNKFLLISFILLVVFSTVIPLIQIATRVYFKKQIFIYYYQEETKSYCQVSRTIDISTIKSDVMQADSNILLATIKQALLMPQESELSNNNNKNIILKSVLLENNTAVLSFTPQFYKLNIKEVVRTTTALMLTSKVNFPKIEQITWLVNSEKALETNDQKDGQLPKIITNYIPLTKQNNDYLYTKALELQKNIINTSRAIMPRERMRIIVGKTHNNTPIAIRDCRLK